MYLSIPLLYINQWNVFVFYPPSLECLVNFHYYVEGTLPSHGLLPQVAALLGLSINQKFRNSFKLFDVTHNLNYYIYICNWFIKVLYCDIVLFHTTKRQLSNNNQQNMKIHKINLVLFCYQSLQSKISKIWVGWFWPNLDF